MPPNRTVYTSYPPTGRGTINTGTTLQVNFGTLRVAKSVLIRNFDTTNDILATANGIADVIVVDAGKTIEINGEYINEITLTNSSGSAVQYQVVMFGG